jgi:hypothetical protein
VHTSRSGVYHNNQAYRRAGTWISDVRNLTQHFMKNGYLAAGYGKICHNRFVEDELDAYSPGYYRMYNMPQDVTHTEQGLPDP